MRLFFRGNEANCEQHSLWLGGAVRARLLHHLSATSHRNFYLTRAFCSFFRSASPKLCSKFVGLLFVPFFGHLHHHLEGVGDVDLLLAVGVSGPQQSSNDDIIENIAMNLSLLVVVQQVRQNLRLNDALLLLGSHAKVQIGFYFVYTFHSRYRVSAVSILSRQLK